jgi:predicted ATP-dependent Lon-type protease
VLVPVGNTQDMADLPQSLLTKTDVMFYPDAQKLLQKGIMEE